MYTVIVADDEDEIRGGIIKQVNWEEVGFKVIGEACNGVEALELVEKLEPDLLLTDIQMPFLSGIELAREVREIRPTVQIAFLSGFDDFAYARQAIQYNIINYMLKPISSKELEEELRKMKQTIDERFGRFTSGKTVKTGGEKSEFVLSLLLDGHTDEFSEEEKREVLESAISCGLLRSEESDNLQFTVIVTAIYDGEENKTSRANVNAVDMILEKYVRCVSCYLKGRVVSVIAATEGQSKKYLHILVDEIIQSVNRIMGLKCMVGVSRSTRGITSCRENYLEAMHALSYSRQNESQVHFIADEEGLGNINQEMIQSTTATLEALLRGGTTGELKEFLEEFSLKITTGKIAPGVADFLIAQMKAGIFKVVYAVAGDSSVQWLDDHFQLNAYHSGVGQVMESYGKYAELCLAAKELIVEQRKKSSEVFCDKALEMIETGYANSNLSIVMVSDEIGVSPNYLSALIKKTTGATFVELLTKKRMEVARELLLCTSLKIREVAEKSGYKDQHYFSYSFKKIVGKSPNQCRRDALQLSNEKE